MSKKLEVEIPDEMHAFLKDKAGPSGMYLSIDEYVRHLIVSAYQSEEKVRKELLEKHLRYGAEAQDEEFKEYNAQTLIAEMEAQGYGD